MDDAQTQREISAAMLSRLNYAVTTVRSGEDAVEYLRNSQVDLVILDMIMDSGMDGLDTYQHVCAIRPGQRSIIVSGFSECDRVRAAQALGAGEYVGKPYTLEQLGLAVKRALHRSR